MERETLFEMKIQYKYQGINDKRIKYQNLNIFIMKKFQIEKSP